MTTKVGNKSYYGLTGGALGMVLFTAIGFAFMFVVFPLFSDDFMYMEPMLGYFDRGEAPWAGLWENWVTHYFVDNLRLSNIVFTLFLLLPKWVGCSLSGVAVFITLRLMLLTACDGERPVSVWAAIWMCLLFTLGLPWFDQIIIMCFQFNYVWPGVLALLCLRIFLGDKRCRPLTALAIGFATGWWHEGFAVPVIAGFAVLMMVWHRRFVSRLNLALIAGLVAGLAVVVLVPSFFYRLGSVQDNSSSINLLYTLRYYIPGLIFVALAALMALSRPMRPVVLSPLCTFVAVCLAVNYVIHLHTAFAMRIGWWANLCSLIGIVYLLYQAAKIRPLGSKMSLLFKSVTAISAILLAVHLVFADVMTVKQKKEIDGILAQYAAAADVPGQVIFTDFTDQLSAPVPALLKPYYSTFNSSWNINQCARWRYAKKHPLIVVPTQLEYVDGTQGDLLPGGVRRIAKNIYYTRCDTACECKDVYGKVLVRDKYKSAHFYCTSFISKADGKRYLYIYPSNMAFRSAGTTIDDILIDPIHDKGDKE